MKQLYILRHAQAAGSGHTDKERELTEQGFSDAEALGGAMLNAEFVPDFVLCSTAVRTRQTLKAALKGMGNTSPAIDYREHLYNASHGDYLAAIQGVATHINALLLVGHNPGIHALAASLANEDNPSMVSRLSAGYAPATLTVLKCDIEDWAALRPYENKVLAVMEATEYNGADRPTRWM